MVGQASISSLSSRPIANHTTELLSRGVCLGRSPGFRPADVNAAIMAAVRAGF